MNTPSTFPRNEIFDFLLNNNFILFAQSWALEKGVVGFISHIDALDWFLTYFPTHQSYKLFREFEKSKVNFNNL